MQKTALTVVVSLLVTATAWSQSAGVPSTPPPLEHKTRAARTTGKTAQLTGCISGPNSDGAYVLTNGRHTKGVEVGGKNDLKNHVGHKVKLKGTWAAVEVGDKEKDAKAETAHGHFKVARITMVADSCTVTAAGEKKGKKAGDGVPSGM